MSDTASNLVGKSIGKWKVVRKLSGTANRGGGGFSSGYQVDDGAGTIGYLKALNIHYALRSTGRNITDVLNDLTGDHIHERNLLTFCKENGLNRIVAVIDDGVYKEDHDIIPVPYLVFELSEKGDVTRHPYMNIPGLAWRLRVFHGVTVGLAQLHKHEIAHQDLKPDNVLVFGNDTSKLADLGRSTRNQPGSRFGRPEDQGAIRYAPFELWYGVCHSEWAVRRKAADIFMLGGILGFLVSNVNLVNITIQKLPQEMQPRTTINPNGWGGPYGQLIPVIRKMLYETVSDLVKETRHDLRDKIERLLNWLCEPDPMLRGHPETVGQQNGNRYSLERIISIADRLAWDARLPEKNDHE